LNASDNTEKESGTEQHKGIEITAAGKVIQDLSLFGGFTILDAHVVNVDRNVTNNTDNGVSGVPAGRVSLFGEYAIDRIPGLSLLGGIYYVSSESASISGGAAQNLSIPGYVTFDAGAKYDTKLFNTPITARLYAENLTNARYWAGAYNGLLTLGEPLMVSASVTASF
jgi:iron complex outermembrane recepter protein